jgi:hypothetical protein
LLAGFGEDGFGVELNALDGEFAVAEAHDDAVLGFGGDVQHARERFALDDEGVVAGGGEGVGEVAEDTLAVMIDRAGFAVEEFGGADDLRTEGRADGLMAQADAENGQLARQPLDQGDGDASQLRGAGAG